MISYKIEYNNTFGLFPIYFYDSTFNIQKVYLSCLKKYIQKIIAFIIVSKLGFYFFPLVIF